MPEKMIILPEVETNFKEVKIQKYKNLFCSSIESFEISVEALTI
jgi:hypothetical protein